MWIFLGVIGAFAGIIFGMGAVVFGLFSIYNAIGFVERSSQDYKRGL